MIQLFKHYVPGRLILLAALEALMLLMAACVGLSLHLAGSGGAVSDTGAVVPPHAVAFALGMVVVISSMGLYGWDAWGNDEFVRARLSFAFLLGLCVMVGISYLMPSLSPGLVTTGATLAIALAGSLLLRAAFYRWTRAGLLNSRVLVLGTGSRVMRLAEYAQRNPNDKIIGYVALQPSEHYVPLSHVLPIGHSDTLLSLVERHSIDKIVVGVRDRRAGGLPVQQLLDCKAKGVKVVELPTYFERQYRQVMLESLNPSWMVFGDGFHQGSFNNAVKRLFDLTVGAVLFLLAFPVMLVAALCIYLQDGLPVLYRQERVGQGGRAFTLYKLRTMRIDAENDGAPQWAEADDDRVTVVGRFIRKWRIDELPQLYNVLRGEMSLVGPRPERAFFVDQLVKQVPYYALRHSAKPGITGWAQVRYAYGSSVDDAIEKLQFDLYYVKNRCLFLDLMTLLATVEVVLWGRGAR